MNFKEINEAFFELESKYDLFNKKINGIYFWELIRFDLNRKILVDKWLITQAHKSIENKYMYILKNITNFLYKWIFKNPFIWKSNSIFIFWHPRRKNIDWIDYDIYTDYLKEELQKNNMIYQDFEVFYWTKYSNKSKFSDDILSLDFFDGLALFFGKKIKLTDSETDFLLLLEKEIFQIMNLKINLLNYISNKLKLFNVFVKLFNKLIKWKNPTLIIELVWYWLIYKALNYSAGLQWVKTIELQHWVIDKFHLWYSMWHNKDIEAKYFPDKVFTWWKYWNNVCNYPSNCDALDVWFHFFDLNKLNNNINRDEKYIIVISQWAIWEELSKHIYSLAKSLKDYTFFYKLHPWEFHKIDNKFSFLKELKNIKIIKWEQTVYDLFNICNIQIWAFSTAIYEWLWFWLKTIIFNLPWTEYLDDLVEKNIIKKVSNFSECESVINNDDFWNWDLFDSDSFFRSDSMDNIIKIIKYF